MGAVRPLNNAGGVEMSAKDRVRDLEERIADLEGRLPAHSAKPSMYRELEDLEDALEQAQREAEAEDAV